MRPIIADVESVRLVDAHGQILTCSRQQNSELFRLVIGGCRSGKSRYALETAENISADRQVFVATCRPRDSEMRLRVERHRRQRSARWRTVEEPFELPEAVESHASPVTAVLVDCLTLWVSNLLLRFADSRPEEMNARFDRLVATLQQADGPVILVSNEVGTGIVPENRLSRMFRDAAGLLNQQTAAVAASVVWMVAGIPVKIK